MLILLLHALQKFQRQFNRNFIFQRVIQTYFLFPKKYQFEGDWQTFEKIYQSYIEKDVWRKKAIESNRKYHVINASI